MSDLMNDEVLRVIAGGADTTEAVHAATGLTRDQVKNALSRLRHSQRIRSVRNGLYSRFTLRRKT